MPHFLNDQTVEEAYSHLRYKLVVSCITTDNKRFELEYREATEEDARKTALVHLKVENVVHVSVIDTETNEVLFGYGKVG